MQNHKPHSQKAPQTGHSIFGTILFSLLAVLAAFLAAADVFCSWQLFVNGQPVPFLETLHTLYQLAAIPALYALALRFPIRLPPLAQKMDRASFLVYLYHSLLITWFNDFIPHLGITKVSLQFLLRVAFIYPVTFLLCILWQWGYGRVKEVLGSRAAAVR